MVKHLTVIIPAYKAHNYIEACLDSVSSQILKPDRVVVGVDGCGKTLDRLMQIKGKYQNLVVVHYHENRGTYVTFNSLLDHVDDYLITFGADDVMHPHLTRDMMASCPCLSKYSGVMCLKKYTLANLGGWRDWRMAADTDMHQRLRRAGVRVAILPQLYEYRQHRGQMSKGVHTGYGSPKREELKRLIKESSAVYIEPVKHEKQTIC